MDGIIRFWHKATDLLESLNILFNEIGILLSYEYCSPEAELAGPEAKRDGGEETEAEGCAEASDGHSEEGQNAPAQWLDASQ